MKAKILLWISFIFNFVFFINAWNADKDFPNFQLLNTTYIGANQFIQKNPRFDGRGVVIFILDSGVDMGVPGLQSTTTGKVKVLDARDCSGEGSVSLFSATRGKQGDEYFVEHPDGFRLYSYDKLEQKPETGRYWIGYLEEKRFQNTKVHDINNNGRTEDEFGILTFEIAEADSFVWLIYIDTDGDHQIDDEKPLHEYHVKHEYFHFRGGDEKFDARPLNFAINIDTYGMIATFHFDSEGHGTHVAGIAAGYKIYGKEGFNGVAPGAQIISLKIGNGTLPGGSTTTGSVLRAVEFIEDFLQKYRKPVVVNLSYGIGAIRPGQSDFSNLLHQLADNHPNVFICASNGNEGPGIATTGCPADDPFVFSVGAFLPHETANAVLGTKLKQDMIYYFSSRGGRLNKPDAIAPGFAVSTVPNFDWSELSRGTSMAAPQVAGAAALLISSIQDSSLEKKITGFMLKNALKQSAVPYQDFPFVDQGNGVINIPAAYELLKVRLEYADENLLSNFEIIAPSPENEADLLNSSYWRSGGYFPAHGEKISFNIYPDFPDSCPADQRAAFFQQYKLRTSEDWIQTDKKLIYFRGERGEAVTFSFDQKKLLSPGLYCAKIYGERSFAGAKLIDFELPGIVVLPYFFTKDNDYQKNFEKLAFNPGELKRFFIKTPPGATCLRIFLDKIAPNSSNFHLFCYNPEGLKKLEIYDIKGMDAGGKEFHFSWKDLTSGIWEIVLVSDMYNTSRAKCDLSFAFFGIESRPEVIKNSHHTLGEHPEGEFIVCNRFETAMNCFGLGEITGYQRKREFRIDDFDYYDYRLKTDEQIQKVKFSVVIPEKDFLRLSDLNLLISNSEGKIIASKALGYNEGDIEFFPSSNEDYNLKIQGAFVHSGNIGRWRIRLLEKYEFKNKIRIKVYSGSDRLFWLYPDNEVQLNFKMEATPPMIPEGYQLYGSIDLYNREKIKKVCSIPLQLSNH